MNCPNCGANIPDGKLYCEKCGNELVIISDIDLELEMKDTMSDIATKEFGKSGENDKKTVKTGTVKTKQQSASKAAPSKKHKKTEQEKLDEMEFDEDDNPSLIGMIFRRGSSIGWMFYVVIIIVIALVLTVAIKFYKSITYQNSLSYQLEMAEEAASDNNLSTAITYLEKAVKLDSDNSEYQFTIAEYYVELDKYDSAVYTLTEIAENTEFSDSDRAKAYDTVISLMKEKSDYSSIGDLLENCELSSVTSKYSNYMVETPEFSVEAGTYNEELYLKLSTENSCDIYYTVDGSDPVSDGILYTGPLYLEHGSYTVKAVAINDYDIPSDVVINKYLIDVAFSFSADVTPESGDYEHAFNIEVEVPLMYTCYYTNDGEEPSKSSKKYTGPIPVGKGESTYKFIVYASDGTASEIVERYYSVNIDTTLDEASAVTLLNQNLIDRGYLDSSGCHREGINGTYLFMYSQVIYVDGMGDFYLVVEYIQDDYGNNKKTGNYYAIDCYNGMLYTVNTEGENGYELTAMD